MHVSHSCSPLSSAAEISVAAAAHVRRVRAKHACLEGMAAARGLALLNACLCLLVLHLLVLAPASGPWVSFIAACLLSCARLVQLGAHKFTDYECSELYN